MEFKERLIKSTLAFLIIASQLLLGVPFYLYANNADEFSSGFLNILQKLLFYGLPLSLVLALLLSLLWFPLFKRLCAVVYGVGICIYLQSSFLVWKVGQLDGKEINWSFFGFEAALDYLVWGVVLLACLVFSAQVFRRGGLIFLVILTVQVLNTAIVVPSFSGSWYTARDLKGVDEFYRFSPDKNIIFIVLDTFESPAFSHIIKKDESYKERFKDFIYYRNTLSPFPTTLPSIPAILTGIPYDNNRPIKEYMKEVLGKSSLPGLLRSNGFQSDITTLSHYCNYLDSDSCISMEMATSNDYGKVEDREAAKLIDVVLLRAVPGQLKKWIYNEQNWRVQQNFAKRKGPRPHVVTIEFVEALQRYAKVKAGKPTFKFFHLMIPHLPIRLDAECNFSTEYHQVTIRDFTMQSRCALHLADMILQTLRQLKVYDQSAIFIFGDHGFTLKYFKTPPNKPNIAKALPLLLVKGFGSQKDFTISEVPAVLTDLPATVHDMLGLNVDISGARPLSSLVDGEMRERRFFSYKWKNDNWAEAYLPELKEFMVRGDAWDV
ncbi:MAG: sulfatase-like hydrolase/transferase, partial [SAR324 cluster bacterium]|nr:sulfatase-like hydrolase/transferase [SAR324 cluster bacterium]